MDQAKRTIELDFKYIYLETGELDEKVISNNMDTDKVLATVAFTLFELFSEFPNSIVYSTISSPNRNRPYQINIGKYIKEIESEFEVFGELEEKIERFKKELINRGFTF